MGRHGTGRHTDRPALSCILGEPEVKLRAWLAKHPGWYARKEHGEWHAGFNGLDLVTDRAFDVFIARLEVIVLVGPGEPPDDIA